MKQTVDKLIVFAMCVPCMLLSTFTTEVVIGLLLALACTLLFETTRMRWKWAFPVVYCVVAVAIPHMLVFLPLVVYDLVRCKPEFLKYVWIIPMLTGLRSEDPIFLLCYLILCLAAFALSWRTQSSVAEEESLRKMRDTRQENLISLAARNKDLQDRQDYELKVATLEERARIAREIHDNVGHLITRGIMQTEAMKVVYADNPEVAKSFDDISTTLHTAMDTVRESVHNLHDDSLDLQGQLQGVLDECGIENTKLEFRAYDVEPKTGYCFLAVVREAVSNTIRHSDADSIEIEVLELPGIYQLVVKDNGSKEPKNEEAGMGLQTMEERVRALNGTIRMSWDGGFKIFASIPKQGAGKSSPDSNRTTSVTNA
jgi:signal transduction histidine kinase